MKMEILLWCESLRWQSSFRDLIISLIGILKTRPDGHKFTSFISAAGHISTVELASLRATSFRRSSPYASKAVC